MYLHHKYGTTRVNEEKNDGDPAAALAAFHRERQEKSLADFFSTVSKDMLKVLFERKFRRGIFDPTKEFETRVLSASDLTQDLDFEEEKKHESLDVIEEKSIHEEDLILSDHFFKTQCSAPSEIGEVKTSDDPVLNRPPPVTATELIAERPKRETKCFVS